LHNEKRRSLKIYGQLKRQGRAHPLLALKKIVPNLVQFLIGFYRGITGVGLVFPRADLPIAVKWAGHAVSTLRPIKGLEFVEETVTALGYSTELAHHLFRECWAVGTGSDVDLCRAFGWEVKAHKFKVATAADLHR
jgi:hypothetical protein